MKDSYVFILKDKANNILYRVLVEKSREKIKQRVRPSLKSDDV